MHQTFFKMLHARKRVLCEHILPEILLGLRLALLRSSTSLRSAQDDTGEKALLVRTSRTVYALFINSLRRGAFHMLPHPRFGANNARRVRYPVGAFTERPRTTTGRPYRT